MEKRTAAILVLVLEKLLFTAGSVLGEERVPLALRVMVPLKEDSRLSATVMPPDKRETYSVLPLKAGFASQYTL